MQEQLWSCSQRSKLRRRGCGLILAKTSLTCLSLLREDLEELTGETRLGVDKS